jgi:NitT/TauT family transport system ATP-binding protein
VTIPASLEPDEKVERKTPHTPSVLEARNVYKVFVARGKARTALRNVDLTIHRGEFVCLVGPSGCGKSTVLNMFAGLVMPTDGTILHDGRVIAGVNTRVGYVTQDDNLLPWRTALANVELALECKGVGRAERRERHSTISLVSA